MATCKKSCGYCADSATSTDPTCQDDPDFTDKDGYYCDEWGPANDFPCEDAEDEGYSAEQAKEIREKCKKSCDLCAEAATTAVPTTTAAPVSMLAATASAVVSLGETTADSAPAVDMGGSGW